MACFQILISYIYICTYDIFIYMQYLNSWEWQAHAARKEAEGIRAVTGWRGNKDQLMGKDGVKPL